MVPLTVAQPPRVVLVVVMLPLPGKLKLTSPSVRVIAPRLSVMLPPAPDVAPIVLLPAVTRRPLNVCVLASPAAPITLSTPPPMFRVEALEMMLLVGAVAAP
ncbi:hypothetical protein D3C84_638160 [compost metagenome]